MLNHRSKIGYTVLGAVIMLFGITVGSIVSPPLVAQRDGSFDEFRCSTLTVVGEGGQVAIRLSTLKTNGDRRKPDFTLTHNLWWR